MLEREKNTFTHVCLISDILLTILNYSSHISLTRLKYVRDYLIKITFTLYFFFLRYLIKLIFHKFTVLIKIVYHPSNIL